MASKTWMIWKLLLEESNSNFRSSSTAKVFNYAPGQEIISGLRVAGPGFEVKHLPWYVDDPRPEDEIQFYKESAKFSSWV